MDITKNLESTLKEALKEIMLYESDTFSASSVSMTGTESQKILAKMIKNKIIGNYDGYDLEELFEEVKED